MDAGTLLVGGLVIVVYKVDRLTRSLADFAKLVELFDQHGVSFVSVTQQFNTTTSMGRLPQRVVVVCPIRARGHLRADPDKIAASKRKGLWVGGMAPLGYDTRDRKITVNEAEAKRVPGHLRKLSQAWQLRINSLSNLQVAGQPNPNGRKTTAT